MSKFLKGHTVSPETRRKIGIANSIALKGRKVPKDVLAKRKATLEKMKASGLFKTSIKFCGECKTRVSFYSKLCLKCAGRKRTGENNHWWRGDNLTYEGIHSWIERVYGKASECENCNQTNRKFSWSNRSGSYKRDRGDWQMLCYSCHKKYDLKRLKSEEMRGGSLNV